LVGGRGVNPGRFYCALSSGEVSRELYKSDDHGVTWTKVATYEAKGESVTGLAYDPSTPDRVYVAVSNAGIRKSDDGGQSWTDLGLAEQKVDRKSTSLNS